MPNPSIGWGYRFAIPAIGPMVLGAVAAWHALNHQDERQSRATGFVVLATVFSMTVLFPLHGWRAANDVRAHAAAQQALNEIDADIVVVDHYSFRTYHLRNDLDVRNRPLFLALPYLGEAARQDLCGGPFDIVVASAGTYEALGIEDRTRRFKDARVWNFGWIEELRALGCQIDDGALRKPDRTDPSCAGALQTDQAPSSFRTTVLDTPRLRNRGCP
jgi:hypothetical protein